MGWETGSPTMNRNRGCALAYWICWCTTSFC